MNISNPDTAVSFASATLNAPDQIDLFDHHVDSTSPKNLLGINLPVDHETALRMITEHKITSNQTPFAYLYLTRYEPPMTVMHVAQDDIRHALRKMGRQIPKNIGDLPHKLQEQGLPALITNTAPPGLDWIFMAKGGGVYCLKLVQDGKIEPSDTAQNIYVKDVSRDLVDVFGLAGKAKLELQLKANMLLDQFLNCKTTYIGKPPSGYLKKLGQVDFDALYAARSACGAIRALTVLLAAKTRPVLEHKVTQMLRYAEMKYPHLENLAVVILPFDKDSFAFLKVAKKPEGLMVTREVHYHLH